MINQSVTNSDARVYASIADSVDSGVSVVVKNMEGGIVESGSTASYDVATERYYHDITSLILVSRETFTISWAYKTSTVDKNIETKLDILDDSQPRYCYQEDVSRKMFDILLPGSFDLGSYTLRATNEVDRALQGLYLLPLLPVSTHGNATRDTSALMELTSDIGAGYAIEDIWISRGTSKYNAKKAAAFAELNRYSDLKKEFSSITKDDVKDTQHYLNDAPRVAASEHVDGGGTTHDDPLNSIYNNFSPRSDRV